MNAVSQYWTWEEINQLQHTLRWVAACGLQTRESLSRRQAGREVETYWFGMVERKILTMHWQVSSQTGDENLAPLDMTRFSRQFVPERASCSLSSRQKQHQTLQTVAFSRSKAYTDKQGAGGWMWPYDHPALSLSANLSPSVSLSVICEFIACSG